MCGIGLTILPSKVCTNCGGEQQHCGGLPISDTAKALQHRMCYALGRRGPDLCDSRFDLRKVCRFGSRSDDGGTREEIETGDCAVDHSLSSPQNDVQSGCDCLNEWHMSLFASVLHMRGKKMTEQPYLLPVNDVGDVGEEEMCALCWNGECYSWDLTRYGFSDDDFKKNALNNKYDVHDSSEEDLSDTAKVMKILMAAIRHCDSDSESGRRTTEHEAVASVMGCIQGEYSFIFYSPNPRGISGHPGFVYFGRDPFGRRSLLMTKSLSTGEAQSFPKFIISSVDFGSREDKIGNELESEPQPSLCAFDEIAAGTVHRLDLSNGEVTTLPIPRQAWPRAPLGSIGSNGADIIVDAPESSLLRSSKELHAYLDNAVRRRVLYHPDSGTDGSTRSASVGVLFSGGLDSVVLAALSHNHVPLDQPIDLINVAFVSASISSSSSPDRLAALISFREMQQRWPERKWRLIAVDVPNAELLENEARICSLISPLESTMDFNIGAAFWFASRGKGREILDFSGLDDHGGGERPSSSVAHSTPGRHDDPLLRFATSVSEKRGSTDARSGETPSGERDSICVKPRCKKASRNRCIFGACKACCSGYQKPINRFLGGGARICPAHNDVAGKKKGSRGGKPEGGRAPAAEHAVQPVIGEDVTSTAKILLVGIGADEQMAGYGRHRTVFDRGGYEALRAELEMERDRLWTRNLGRDDRCISDHGKEARFPFLDEDVASYLRSLDVEDICDMRRPQGEGDKMILRLVARELGVMKCSGLVKRAIQFGSRIAKVSDVDRFGSSRKASGSARHVASRGGGT